MTRREFFCALPATAGLAGCLSLDPRWTPPLTAEDVALSESNAAVAFDLFAQLKNREGNLVFSPFVTTAALAMSSAAAGGATQSEFERVLHWPPQNASAHPSFAALQRHIAAGTAQSGCELRAAYSLWAATSLAIRKEFRRVAERHYAGGLQAVDFAQPESAARAINHWAEMQTAFKIKELIGASDLADDARMALISAVSLKGLWAQSFPRAETTIDSFRLSDGRKIPVNYMRHTSQHRYAESEKRQVVELALAGGNLVMHIILPRTLEELAVVESAFTRESYDLILQELQPRELAVALPSIQFKCAFRMREPLAALGLESAFRGETADFSRLCSTPGLALHTVVHKAAVEFTEEGSQPPSAIARKRSPGKVEVKNLVADRPFLFAVRDTSSGSLLLLGRVADPS
jgi:serpin B